MDGWRSDEDHSVCRDSSQSQQSGDLLQVFRVLFQRDVLLWVFVCKTENGALHLQACTLHFLNCSAKKKPKKRVKDGLYSRSLTGWKHVHGWKLSAFWSKLVVQSTSDVLSVSDWYLPVRSHCCQRRQWQRICCCLPSSDSRWVEAKGSWPTWSYIQTVPCSQHRTSWRQRYTSGLDTMDKAVNMQSNNTCKRILFRSCD